MLLAIGALAFGVVIGAMLVNDVRENSAFFGLADWLISVGVTLGLICLFGTVVPVLF